MLEKLLLIPMLDEVKLTELFAIGEIAGADVVVERDMVLDVLLLIPPLNGVELAKLSVDVEGAEELMLGVLMLEMEPVVGFDSTDVEEEFMILLVMAPTLELELVPVAEVKAVPELSLPLTLPTSVEALIGPVCVSLAVKLALLAELVLMIGVVLVDKLMFVTELVLVARLLFVVGITLADKPVLMAELILVVRLSFVVALMSVVKILPVLKLELVMKSAFMEEPVALVRLEFVVEIMVPVGLILIIEFVLPLELILIVKSALLVLLLKPVFTPEVTVVTELGPAVVLVLVLELMLVPEMAPDVEPEDTLEFELSPESAIIAEFDTDEAVEGDEDEDEDEDLVLEPYMLNRSGPPHSSVLLPEQAILQSLLPLAAERTDPIFKELPQ